MTTKEFLGLPIALQTWSLVNIWDDDIISTLRTLKKAGITSIEVSAPCKGTCQGVRNALENVAASCQKLGLSIIGYHAPALFQSRNPDGSLAPDNPKYVKEQIEEIGYYCQKLGTANVTIMDQKWYTSEKYPFDVYAELLNEAAKELKKIIITRNKQEEKVHVYFHVYKFNLKKTKSKPKSELEILFHKTDPKLIGLQLDTYWLAEAGYTTPDMFFEQNFGAKEPDWIKERRISIHLGNLPQNHNNVTGVPESCALDDITNSCGKVDCKAWLEFIKKNNGLGTTAGVQNVILEFMPSTFKPETWGKKVDPILKASIDWMRRQGTK